MLKFKKHCREAPEPSDGYRVLACRYWPRGLRKEAVDVSIPALAPSKTLLSDFRTLNPKATNDQKLANPTWWHLIEVYLSEMREQEGLIEALRQRHEANETVTLLCACHDYRICHRTFLAGAIAWNEYTALESLTHRPPLIPSPEKP